MLFDDVLSHLGEFGRYQLAVFLLAAIIPIPTTWFTATEVFSAPKINHWCSVPELEVKLQNIGLTVEDSKQAVLSLAIPPSAGVGDNAGGGNSYCTRYNFTGAEFTPNMSFDSIPTVPCDNGWNFNKSVYRTTALEDFDLVCAQDDLVELTQTLFFLTSLLGVTFFGVIGDKFGRKKALIVCLVVQGPMGLACAFSPSYPVYLTFRMIIGFVNQASYLMCYVILNEVVGPSKRNLATMLFGSSVSLGSTLISVISLLTLAWRPMQFIMSIPSCIFILLALTLPESPRWYLSVGKHEAADNLLRRMAKVNKKELPDELFTESELREFQQDESGASILDLLRSPTLRSRQFIIVLTSFITGMTFTGLVLNSGNIGPNDHISYILIALMECPSFIMAFLLLDRIGRRFTLFGCLLLAGTASLVTAFMEPYSFEQTVVAMVTKFGITGCFCVIDLFVLELMPTPVRSVAAGLNATGFGLGSMIAPFVNRLQVYWVPMSMVLLGGLCILVSPCVLVLPETMGKVLPSTIEEGERFGKKSKAKPSDESSKKDIFSSPSSVHGMGNEAFAVEAKEDISDEREPLMNQGSKSYKTIIA